VPSTIVITGAGRGLGLELARQYAAEGWDVIGTVRDAAAEEALSALGARVLRLDVTDFAAVKALRGQVDGVPIDILFCNAGISGKRGMALGSFDYGEWEKVLRVNLLGTAAVIEALVDNVAASMRKTVAIMSSRMGSISGTTGATLPYSTSKAALNLLARGLSATLAPRGILVAALHPGWVKTDMGGASAPLTPEASVRGIRRVLDGLRQDDSGKFLSYDGTEIPW
jgi:NAD(P)-dependent dehydrogenase (short-subunit alcohol dehydrogenase family)